MLDLFGEVVVTSDDIRDWVAALAPGFAISEIRLAHYVKHWHVADKVRAAKLAGTFDTIIENARAKRAYLLRRLGVQGGIMAKVICTVVAAAGAALFWLIGGRHIDPDHLE